MTRLCVGDAAIAFLQPVPSPSSSSMWRPPTVEPLQSSPVPLLPPPRLLRDPFHSVWGPIPSPLASHVNVATPAPPRSSAPPAGPHNPSNLAERLAATSIDPAIDQSPRRPRRRRAKRDDHASPSIPPIDSRQQPSRSRPLSVREYNRRISAYARKRDLQGALRTLSELDRSPSVSRNLFTYNAVINALVVCSQYARAHEFWRAMQDAGIQPNLVTYNTMLKSCFGGSEEDVKRAFGLLEEMKERGIAADRVTLNSLINACVSAGRVSEAQKVYEMMRVQNIEPDAYTFCTLAKQARHSGDISMLDALLLHQLHHHTLKQPDNSEESISPVAYNTIADAYIRCGYPERAMNLIERMRYPNRADATDVIPVFPDVQTYNVRLKALRESGAPASEAFDALSEMSTHGLEADHITLLTLADLCCRREEMSLAEGVLRAATEADIREHDKASPEWRALCSARKDNNRLVYKPSNINVQNNGRRNANQPKNAKANAALFNALIRGYSSLDPPDVDRAVALYGEMRWYVKTYGFNWYAADSVTYTMLVDSFARIGDAARAEVIISEMEAAGRSNVVAYNAYLKANRGNGFQAALSILDRMKHAGLRPDVVTYNTVIDYLSSEENGSQIAEELVRVDMPRNGVKPDLLTFNTLIKGVARNRGNKSDASSALSAAYKWLKELQSRGLKPDEFTYQSMVSACAAAGDAPRALEFFRKVEAERAKRVKANGRLNGFSHSTPSMSAQSPNWRNTALNGTLSGFSAAALANTNAAIPMRGMGNRNSSKVGLSGQIHGTSDWMLLPHPAAYVALMRAFLSSGAKDGVTSVLLLRDEMVARGLELGRTGYTAVADAYAERADCDNVEATLKDMMAKDPQSQNMKLGPVHHCIRMKALCNAGRLDDAIAILPEVENADTAVFNVLICACAKNKDMDRLISVLREMEARQIQPDSITSRAMSSIMRNVARTLKTFDERFTSSITKFVDNVHSQPEPLTTTNALMEPNKPSIWKLDGDYFSSFDSSSSSKSLSRNS
ncbi:unnamed protein product [Agarophyton chilense]|eukprot:gb/GEZJ01000580.1/.p1 GENE.gb/GEZJ01000580.1/~~gb/GEZJ01000580.1/.p1  ORF type:complete len:1064 (-),score=171.91 gb/GEZJ01000580.1/:6333-9389(-)